MKSMIQSILFGAVIFLCGMIEPAMAQSDLPKNTDPVQLTRQDSVNLSIMFKEQLRLKQQWKDGLKKRQRRTTINSTIGGALVGVLTGALVALPIQVSCEVTTLPITVTTSENQCGSIIGTGALVGALLGGTVGFSIGKSKAKKMEIPPSFF